MEYLFNSIKKIIWGSVLLTGMTAVVLVSAGSCKKAHLCDIRPEIEAVNETSEAFNASPDSTTCEAARKAGLALLEKVDRCPNIVPVTPEMRESIEELRNTDCSKF